MSDPTQRLYDALKRIASYTPPEKLRRTAMKDYGLEGDEAIEMAYDNVIQEAKNAIKGMRRPGDSSKPKIVIPIKTGFCKEKAKPGGCPLHNLFCGYPKCDQKPANSVKEGKHG